MSSRSKLFSFCGLYETARTDTLFLSAMREALTFHLHHCPEYSQLMKQQGFSIESLCSIDDLYRIPPLPTLFLKRHELFAIPLDKLPFKAPSSGTGGTVSRVGFDWNSSGLALHMALRTFIHHKLVSPRPTNYIVLGYQPHKSNQIGAVKTAYATTLAAPALHREYALRYTPQGYEVNLNGLKNALLRYQKAGHPVRFMGFPAYLLFLLETLEESGIQLKLHSKSKIFLAGGWKQFFLQQRDKKTLYSKAEEILGIAEHNCQDFFGAVEHPIIYCDCRCHHFHVPVYSRVIIRDPRTLEPLPMGTPGLLNLISPLVRSMPLSSIITDDLAVFHDAQSCDCGNPSPWFELLGRAGLTDIKTCAAGAAELLGGIKL